MKPEPKVTPLHLAQQPGQPPAPQTTSVKATIPMQFHSCAERMAPIIEDMSLQVEQLHRIGCALSAVSSITTCGDPSRTNLGLVSSGDMGALLDVLGSSVKTSVRSLEASLYRATETSDKH